MAIAKNGRILVERPLPQDGREKGHVHLPGLHKARKLRRSVTINLVESPLGWLRARKLISERQFDAGEQLRNDWERAQLAPSMTMKWDAPPTAKVARGTPQIADPTTAQIAAKLRFEEALEAVGPGLSDIVWRIVCAGDGMRDAEQALGWPARAGRIILSLALDRLADHYRLAG